MVFHKVWHVKKIRCCKMKHCCFNDDDFDLERTLPSPTSIFGDEDRMIIINSFLGFDDPKMNQAYENFRVTAFTKQCLLLMSLGVTLFGIVYWVFVLMPDYSLFNLIVMVISMLPLIFLWILVFARYTIPLSKQRHRYRPLLTWMESAFIVGISITTALNMIMRIHNGLCTSLNFLQIWDCLLGNTTQSTPAVLVVALSLSPIVFLMSLPFVPFSIVLFCALFNNCFCIGIFIWFDAILSISTYVVSSSLAIFFIYCFRLYHVELFVYFTKFQYLSRLRQQEYQARQDQLQQEMKSFLGSISHDMKTVSGLPYCYLIVFLIYTTVLLFYCCISP